MVGTVMFLLAAGLASASPAVLQKRQQYFQTSPELYPGPTPTGTPAFLAQTNQAPFPGKTYIPPQPLETQVPISGAPKGGNIYQLHGELSHYFPNPVGFGIEERPLPENATISEFHMLHRHGSRYPTDPLGFVSVIEAAKSKGNFNASGELAFLNDWEYALGEQILTFVGQQELFDSGVLHQYLYGHLYPNNGTKIVARTTTEDRMTKSAEYFLAGFFGLKWTQNATIVEIIESDEGTWNNSLAGYDNCANSNSGQSLGGQNASEAWYERYLAPAHARLNALIEPAGLLNVSNVYDMQSLCAYETVALGYSRFCGLFTYEEWESFEYSIDLSFSGNNAYQSPTGRAVGIGYVEELRARLQHKLITEPTAQVNTTLDGMESTFPLNQTLYFDFSHDTNIMSILTAFNFTRFNAVLPTDHMVPHELVVSHLEPFAARLDMEIINTPAPLDASCAGYDYSAGSNTTYIHFLLNQRTLPLPYEQCGGMANGWCEIGAFLEGTSGLLDEAQYDYSCNGDYLPVPYGTLTNGVPQAKS